MRPLIAASLCLFSACLPGTSAALSSDRNQPMYVEADRADIDDKRGVSVYRGNVKITQGTLQLTAAELTVHSKNGDITQAVAVGQPATYRQRPDGKDQDVEAEALRMEYDADQQTIILIDKAEVRQGGDTFRSDRIHYDIAKDLVNAGSGVGTGASGPGQRVHITIQPKPKKPSPAPTDGTPPAPAPVSPPASSGSPPAPAPAAPETGTQP